MYSCWFVGKALTTVSLLPDRLATAARYQGSITTLTCTAIHHLQGTQGPPEAKAISHLWYTFLGDKKPMITNKKCQTNGSGDFCNGPRNVCTYTYINIYIYSRNARLFLNKYLYTI